MNNFRPPTEIAEQPSGNTKEVTWFRKVLKNVRERTVTVGPGLRCSYTTEGTRIELAKKQAVAGASESASAGKRLQIIASPAANYLTCRAWSDDGATVDGTENIIVAIPYFLRASTYVALTLGGFRYVTVAGQIRCSNAPGSDTAYVVKSFFPTYGIGQDIYAIQPEGKTDVTVAAGIVPNTTAATRVEWIDANVEGRRLDTAQVQLSVCRLEGSPAVAVTRAVVVEGGPVF